MPLGLDAHENGDLARVDVERAHHARHLGDLVLVVERDDADAVGLKRQAYVGLRLDRVHVEHLGLRRDGSHRLEFGGRGHIERLDSYLGQCFEHHGLAIGLDRISRLAGKHAHELPRVFLQHIGTKAIDRIVGSKGERGFAGIFEFLHVRSCTIRSG